MSLNPVPTEVSGQQPKSLTIWQMAISHKNPPQGLHLDKNSKIIYDQIKYYSKVGHVKCFPVVPRLLRYFYRRRYIAFFITYIYTLKLLLALL